MASQTLTEWSEARAIIGRFDNNLHDLRKYGFSFVTAILTADAILSHTFSSATSEVTWYEKWAVLFVTIGLILALRLLDQHYRLIQKAASQRAVILEERMSIDLTEDFGTLYELGGWKADIENLYDGFLLLTFVLGLAILLPHYYSIFVLGAVVFLMSCIREALSERDLKSVMDWSIDSGTMEAGQSLRISLTDLYIRPREGKNLYALIANMVRRWTGPLARAKKHTRTSNDSAPVTRSSGRAAEKEGSRPLSEVPPERRPLTWRWAWAVFSEKDEALDFESGTVVDFARGTKELFYRENIHWLWNTADLQPGLYTIEMDCVLDTPSQGTPREPVESFGGDRVIQIVGTSGSPPEAAKDDLTPVRFAKDRRTSPKAGHQAGRQGSQQRK